MFCFCLDLMLKAMMMMISDNGFLGGAESVFQGCPCSEVEQAPFQCVCAALCSELSRSDV